MSMLAAVRNNSPARCGIEPGPVDAKFSCPGFALASASNSFIEAAGTPVQEIRTYVDFGEAYADLGAGRLAAVVNSLPNQLEAARQRPDAFEVVLPTFGPKKYFAWAGRKDADSASLNAFMDEQIRQLNQSGVLAELQRKWFGDVMELPSDALPEPAE